MKTSSSGQLKSISHHLDSYLTHRISKQSGEKSNRKSRKTFNISLKSHTKNPEKTIKTRKNSKPTLIQVKSLSSTIPNSTSRSPLYTNKLIANLSPPFSKRSARKEKDRLSSNLKSSNSLKKNLSYHKRIKTSGDRSMNKEKFAELFNSDLFKTESIQFSNTKDFSENKSLMNRSDEDLKQNLSQTYKSSDLEVSKVDLFKPKIRPKYSLEIPMPKTEDLSKYLTKDPKKPDPSLKAAKSKSKKPGKKTKEKPVKAKSKLLKSRQSKKSCLIDRNLSVVRETSRTSTVKTENEEWVNIGDLNIESSNSYFVEEFKSKIKQEFSQLVKQNFNCGQVTEQDLGKYSDEYSSIISSDSICIEYPLEVVYKVQSPARKYENVPKLSFASINDEVSLFSQRSLKNLQSTSELLNSCKACESEFGKSSENLVESTKDPSLDSVTVKCISFDKQGSERNLKFINKK